MAIQKTKDLKVKSILVSQPKPESDKSPYLELAKKWNIKVDFHPFINVEGIAARDFRKDRVNILDFTAVIITSRNAIHHFFRMCSEMRILVPETMKYFCMSEATAFYLQKYVQYRKRKIFHGKQKFSDLIEIIKKHKQERFIVPCSDIHKLEIPKLLDENKINYKKAVIYRTIATDLTAIDIKSYDMVVFFSPAGVKSMLDNFPDFKQNAIRIAAFGPTTMKAIIDAGLRLDIEAPQPQSPSMTMAIESYLQKVNKK